MFAPIRRTAALFAIVASTLMLGSCMFTPGKFTSTMTLTRGGDFRYVYDGEISVFSLVQLARMKQAQKDEPCLDDDGAKRACTDDEVAARERKSRREQKEAEQFAQFLGGLDPGDPATAMKLVERLKRQKGWTRVALRDESVLDVRFETSGRLSHDFLFPTIEGIPPLSQFVTAMPRADGSVRVEAPGFGGEANRGIGPGMGFMAMMSGFGAEKGDEDAPEMILPDGTFTILTDGVILANNTDEGPADADGGMKRLSWPVNASSSRAPMALIDLN